MLYWNNTGKYENEYKKLYDELVPISGSAETLHGELIRAISKLYREYFNNGNINAQEQEWGEEEVECWECCGEEDDCDNCWGSNSCYEEQLVDITVDEFYNKFIDLIENTIYTVEAKETCNEIRRIIVKEQTDYENDSIHYDNMVDIVLEYILSDENLDIGLPDTYEKD